MAQQQTNDWLLVMISHTHHLTNFATIIGRTVIFMSRPAKTRQKAYREPVVVKRKRYQSKAQAELAKTQWEGQLI